MLNPGRASTAELSTVSIATIETTDRPDPPTELTQEQSRIWVATVSRLPSDWFPKETHELLAQYCCYVVSAKRLSSLISEEEAKDSEEFDPRGVDLLLKMREREVRSMSSLATRMRITQQTTNDKSKKKGSSLPKPWES